MTDNKGKKAKLDEVDGSELLDTELVASMQKLQEVQDELEKVNEEANDKVLEIEQKYNEVRRPIYQKRNSIIQEIPDFWLTAFLSHPALCEFLTAEDQKVFKFLSSLDVEDFKDVKSGYSISFTFKPNSYFEDKKLTKVFRFSEEGTFSISGTQPRWKSGMDYTNGAPQEKEGNKRPFAERSFFKWFTDDAQQKETSEGIHHDEVAEIIKEDLWPNPLKYFNNDPDEDDDEDDDDDGEDEVDDDEDDDDEGNGPEALDDDEEPSDEEDD